MAARATPSAARESDEKSDKIDLLGSNNGGGRGRDLLAVESVAEHKKLDVGEYSPKPKKSRQSEYSPCEIASEKVVDFAAFKAKVTIHSSAVFDDDRWKRSRIKKGYLIARIKGYDPVESEYGVYYLKVLRRKPKKTSGDCSLYEHAGFFTWEALQAGGRLVRERKRYERVSGDGAHAS